jgi:transcriptional regulator with XRE-family HTH domain
MQRKKQQKKLNELGKILEKARGDRSLAEVAKKMRLSFGYLAKLERGEVPRPKIEMLRRVIKFYGLDYDNTLYLSDKLAEDVYWKMIDNRHLWNYIRTIEA